MSTTASAATETAVRASISTPVRSAVRTVAVMVTPSSVIVEVDDDAVHADDVRERQELGGALGGGDAGDAGDREDVALRHVAGPQRGDDGRAAHAPARWRWRRGRSAAWR